MEYRKMENLGISTSLLGFGCMRFPTNADGSIDEEEALAMIDRAYQAGVTYFDTAYPYHGGMSEVVTGKALARYPRDSYYLATKLPLWSVKTIADVERIFSEQLERLQKDHVDFYLMHALGKDRWRFAKELDVLGYCERLRAEGKIRYLGFSFHDDYEAFEEIITSYKWDFCQIQLNYMDKDTQATLKGVELAEKLGIPIVVMEPVKGGSLANLPSEGINELFQKMRPGATASSWALRYAGSFDNVKVVLSGMSTMEQLEDNISYMQDFKPLDAEERATVETAVGIINRSIAIPCTACRYCVDGCPKKIAIPEYFALYNNVTQSLNKGFAVQEVYYANLTQTHGRASECIACRKCEKSCPQHLPIVEHLRQVSAKFDGPAL